MPKLMSSKKWIEQINEMIDRLNKLDCDKCLPEWLAGMKNNNIITEFKVNESSVDYTISGKEQHKELI